MAKNFKIVVYVPISDADKIRQVFAEAGAGQVGNYDSTSFSVKGTGRFRPLAGAKPAVGVVGKLEEVEEERIETVVRKEDLKEVVFRIRKAHPYEEPVIDVFELEEADEDD
ncbi:MAG: hypothetical protein A3K06_03905 [Candidatus Doudnabacteria bacterium RIFCSPHIGHO2_01_52_17]|uniref:NGG1p interacting factor NIF3 n=1 Tax=Candidatus Doudnabacteria bacterium RIFCSPHIGHO2_01_52_17 TaxID=1817820 RepID=A0A1F5NFP4_9BACT|nr:MAG: hypothetical protein A3K06_03905 [Candidatus Doudnabacteria bacterium RIFCSPHIGHO2_01_52_17]